MCGVYIFFLCLCEFPPGTLSVVPQSKNMYVMSFGDCVVSVVVCHFMSTL